MRVISFANHKGGTGKSTVTLNTAILLAQQFGKHVLMIDIDPQGSLTGALLEANSNYLTLHTVLGEGDKGELALADIIQPIEPNLFLAAGGAMLSRSEIGIASRFNREYILKNALALISAEFDITLIDCPPSLSLLTINALTASDAVIIPTQPAAVDLRGTALFLETLSEITAQLNPQLQNLGLILTFHDARYKHHQNAVDVIDANNLSIMGTIGRTVKVQEATTDGNALHEYDPTNPQVAAFKKIATQVNAWLESEQR